MQVAGRADAHPGLALALEPDPRSILDTRRNPNRVALGAPLTPGAMALRARLLDHGAVAAATRARLRERKEPLALGLDSAAVALGADDRGSSGLCAGAAALAARRVHLDGNLRLHALERVLEGEVDDRLDVGAAHPGRLSPAAPAAPGAEDPAEDVAEIADVEVAEVEVAASEARRAVGAEGVVLLALVGVGQEVVGRLDVLEPLLRGRVARVPVRVVLAGELAVGLLDLVRGGVLGDTEGVVRSLHSVSSAGGADTTTRAGRSTR